MKEFFLAALLAALPAAAANTAHFTLSSPADLAVVPDGAASVTLAFQVDWAGVKATYGDTARVGLSLTFPCCISDAPLGGWILPGEVSKSFAVSDILQAMAAHRVPTDSAVQWSIHTHKGLALTENATSRFFVKPPHRPGPRLVPTVSPDSPGAWPAKIVVANAGDARSDAAILTVKTTVAGVQNPLVRALCKPAFADFTKDVLPLEPGASAEFPTIGLAFARPIARGLVPPASPSASRGPVKPTPATVPCTFELTISLGPGAGSRYRNVTGIHGSLTRVIHTNAPVN